MEKLRNHVSHRTLGDGTRSTVSKRVLILRTWSLFRTFLAFWVLYGSLFIFQGPYFHYFSSFTQRMPIQSACIQQWFRFKLLANFDFHLCLRFDFHTLSFWVLILAALGPYWVLISQKNGSLPQSLGSLLVLEAVL